MFPNGRATEFRCFVLVLYMCSNPGSTNQAIGMGTAIRSSFVTSARVSLDSGAPWTALYCNNAGFPNSDLPGLFDSVARD